MQGNMFATVDDKYILLHQVLWVAKTPHFCGREDCDVEGRYEVRLVQNESVWANGEERDGTLKSLSDWHNPPTEEGDSF